MILYHELYQLILKHPYFMDGICDVVDLKPSIDSYIRMKSRNILFRKTAKGVWSVVAEDTISFSSEDVITIEAIIKDPLFGLYTEKAKSFFPYTLKPAQAVASGEAGPVLQTVTFEFPVKTTLLEYRIIPRNDRKFENLTLEDKNGTIKFTRVSNGDNKGFRFLSTNKVLIKESSAYNFTLYDIHDYNRKQVILRNVPPPVPGQFIPPDPDTLQTIVYI